MRSKVDLAPCVSLLSVSEQAAMISQLATQAALTLQHSQLLGRTSEEITPRTASATLVGD